jgi:hypothetical protein
MAGMALAKTRHPRPKRVGHNSTLGEKTAVRAHSALASAFGGRTVLKLIGILAAIVLVVGGIFWYKQIYTDPERVFWGMVNNNLSTISLSKDISQNGTNASSQEYTMLAFSPSPAVRDIKEVSSKNANTSSTIKIESIGTPADTYQHYVLIKQSSKTGKKSPDYSKVYSLWLKNSGSNQHETQLFSNAIYSAMLFGNLQLSQRNQTVGYLKDAYHVDFTQVKKESVNGRKTYSYNVKLGLRNYAKAANFYAKTLGLPNSGQINPNNYKPTEEVSLVFNIDVLSRQARSIQYLSSGATEKYSTYGVVPNFKPPTHTVSYETLQKTVQKAAKQ